MNISPVLRDIVGILPISPMPTLIAWFTVASACACFHRQWVSDQNFWYKLYQIENLGSKFDSDGDLEILLDNADDANTNKLIKYVVTHRLEVIPVIM